MAFRRWAFWRRLQYFSGFGLFFAMVFGSIYMVYFYQGPSCFDGNQNANERGVDCGGECVRICAIDVLPLTVNWSESFEVVDGQYNAVAYIENRNFNAGVPELNYVFKLYDDQGLIIERGGTTVLPPDSVYPIFEGRLQTGDRVPTRTEIELFDDDLVWVPAEAGPQQFDIQQRTLIGADTTPRLDARLLNNEITDARDVEVVATIFDSLRRPLTASRTFVEIFRGRSTEEIVFTWPEPIATTIRSCEIPTDVLLAIDLSGSMNDDGGDPPEPITSVLRAAEAFVGRLGTSDQSGVVTYASDAETARTLTGNTEEVASFINALSITPEAEVGSTNTGDALKLAEAELNSDRHNGNARKVLVLLTDGLANAPGDDPEGYALAAATALKETDIIVYTIGLGDNVNEAFLEEIATTPEQYYQAASVSTLDTIYRSITASICEDGPAIIEIIPKTGARFTPLR